jgi:competence protein ComEC
MRSWRASVESLGANVLVVPRHARFGGTSLELLSRARPEICVVMAGRDDRPSRTVLRRIDPAKTGAALYRTDRDGTIEIVTNGRAIAVTTEERP